jgi:hypothetical protein
VTPQIASFPTKCKIFVRRKEQLDTMVDTEKPESTEVNATTGDDKGGMMQDTENMLGEKPNLLKGEEDDE